MSRMARVSARGRGSELPQRLSPRPAFQLRTSSSDSDPLHNRPIVDRSPKLGDRRSPRGSQLEPLHQKKKLGTPESVHQKKLGTPESVHQKKLGTRVSDLESQLGQAQEELKKLKNQLVTAESAKKEAQEELEKKKKPIIPNTEEQPLPPPLAATEIYETNEKNSNNADDSTEEVSRETDVFEVPVPTTLSESKTKSTDTAQHEDSETKRIEKCTDPPLSEPEKPSLNDLVLLNDEINLLKAKLGEKVEEVEALHIKNKNLNMQITEAAMTVASAQAKEEETVLKLSQMGKELEESKANGVRLSKDLETMEEAKAALESEMKKLRVQTEQWRKAADAAAAVLSGEMEMNGRRVEERCSSMEKHLVGGVEFDPMWNDDFDDAFEGGKKKTSGMKMFGDLWKKKGQK